MTDEEKSKVKKGCLIIVIYIVWYFCIPMILSKIWNECIAQKFDIDILFSYWEMWAVWFGYQLFTGKFKIDLSDSTLKELDDQ